MRAKMTVNQPRTLWIFRKRLASFLLNIALRKVADTQTSAQIPKNLIKENGII